MAQSDTQVHWRDAARKTRFFWVDAIAALPFLFFLIHIEWWSFLVALVCSIFFGILAKFGFTLQIFGVRVRALLAGRHKAARPWWRQ